jgi:hypothetical protein
MMSIKHPEAGSFSSAIIVSLRDELLQRLRTADEIVGLYFGAVGAIGGFAISVNNPVSERGALILLLIPLLSVPAATLIYQQQILISAIAEYLATDVAQWALKNGFELPPWEHSLALQRARHLAGGNLRVLYSIGIPGPALLAVLIASIRGIPAGIAASVNKDWPTLAACVVIATFVIAAIILTLKKASACWKLWIVE